MDVPRFRPGARPLSKKTLAHAGSGGAAPTARRRPRRRGSTRKPESLVLRIQYLSRIVADSNSITVPTARRRRPPRARSRRRCRCASDMRASRASRVLWEQVGAFRRRWTRRTGGRGRRQLRGLRRRRRVRRGDEIGDNLHILRKRQLARVGAGACAAPAVEPIPIAGGRDERDHLAGVEARRAAGTATGEEHCHYAQQREPVAFHRHS